MSAASSRGAALRGARRFFMCAFALLAGHAVLSASTITQVQGFHLFDTSPTATLTFNPFDNSLGTLDSVAISFDVTLRHDLAVFNAADGASRQIDCQASLTGATISFSGSSFGFADLNYGPGTTPLLAPVSLVDFFSEFNLARAEFLNGLDPVIASAFSPGVNPLALNGNLASAGFGWSLDLAFDPGVFSASADNAFVTSLVDVTGGVKVIYNYHVPAVPDEAPVLPIEMLSWLAIAAVVLSLRRQRVRF